MIANARRTVVFNLTHTNLTGDEIRVFLAAPFPAIDQRSIKERLGDTERGTVHASHQSHGAVRVTRKARLEERRVKPRDCRRNPRINTQQPRRFFNGTRKLARRNAGRVEFNAHDARRGADVAPDAGRHGTPSADFVDTTQPMHRQRMTLIACALVAAVAPVGCQRYPYDPDKATRPFPKQLKQASMVDIQVIPTVTEGTIKVVNPTATSYRNFDLWINQRYVRHVDALLAGESLDLAIDSFWDERGEGPFPGGWFRYYDPTPIVLVQIQPTPESPLIGLISKPPDSAKR